MLQACFLYFYSSRIFTNFEVLHNLRNTWVGLCIRTFEKQNLVFIWHSFRWAGLTPAPGIVISHPEIIKINWTAKRLVTNFVISIYIKVHNRIPNSAKYQNARGRPRFLDLKFFGFLLLPWGFLLNFSGYFVLYFFKDFTGILGVFRTTAGFTGFSELIQNFQHYFRISGIVETFATFSVFSWLFLDFGDYLGAFSIFGSTLGFSGQFRDFRD